MNAYCTRDSCARLIIIQIALLSWVPNKVWAETDSSSYIVCDKPYSHGIDALGLSGIDYHPAIFQLSSNRIQIWDRERRSFFDPCLTIYIVKGSKAPTGGKLVSIESTRCSTNDTKTELGWKQTIDQTAFSPTMQYIVEELKIDRITGNATFVSIFSYSSPDGTYSTSTDRSVLRADAICRKVDSPALEIKKF